MNTDVVMSFIRQALTLVGGILVTKGYLDSTTLTSVVGAIATLISAGWSFATHKNTA